MPRPKKTDMAKHLISRRGFLRLSVIAAGSVWATACQNELQDIATATSLPSPSATANSTVKLNLGTNLDAWTWIKQVRVGLSEGECEKVVLQVNGQEVATQPDGDAFTAEIELAEGENQINAVCLHPGGGEAVSEPVIYTGRLRQVPTSVIQISLEGGKILLDGSQSLPARGTPDAIVDYLWSAREDNPSPLRELTSDGNNPSLSIDPPPTDGEYYVRLQVKD